MDQETLFRNAKTVRRTLAQILRLEALVHRRLAEFELDPGAGSFILQPRLDHSRREIGADTAYRNHGHRLTSRWRLQQRPDTDNVCIEYQLQFFPTYHPNRPLIELTTVVNSAANKDTAWRGDEPWSIRRPPYSDVSSPEQDRRIWRASEAHLQILQDALRGRVAFPDRKRSVVLKAFARARAYAQTVADVFADLTA